MYGWLPAVCDLTSPVVTASRRLARVLATEYNARQQASGRLAWLTPAIAAWPDWLAGLLDSAGTRRQATRINSQQSRVLWEKALREAIDDPLVNIPGLTRHARDAWKRMHEWRVPFEECISAASSRDQHIFASAALRYRERLLAEDWIDDAMLATTVIQAVRAGEVAVPSRLMLAGFDRLTPEADELLAALRERGTRIEQAGYGADGPHARLVACDDPDAELRAAGAWALSQLREDPQRRVAIVV